MFGLLKGQVCSTPFKKGKKVLIPKGVPIDDEMIADISVDQLEGIVLNSPEISEQIHQLLEQYREQCAQCRNNFERQATRFEKGDDLAPGVIKMVKVYVAMKRKLSVGDKMAGRHGNKGVVSRILPQEDLPYFADGTPVDMVLNPLGVPSRMNVGQVLEIHLGFAAKGLGDQINRLVEQKKLSDLREKFARIFSSPMQEDSEIRNRVAGMSDDELARFCRTIQAGRSHGDAGF